MYDVAEGLQIVPGVGRYPVLTEAVFYMSGNPIAALDAKRIKENPEEWKKGQLWEVGADASGDLIKAGNRLFAGGEGKISAIDLPPKGVPRKPAWTKLVDGTIVRLLAADEKLFAVTLDGRILAYGADSVGPRQFRHQPEEATPSRRASAILAQSGVTDGYALVYGIAIKGSLRGWRLSPTWLLSRLTPT